MRHLPLSIKVLRKKNKEETRISFEGKKRKGNFNWIERKIAQISIVINKKAFFFLSVLLQFKWEFTKSCE